MKINSFVILLVAAYVQCGSAQTTLEANGPGDTYELINSVLAPNYNVIEAPDCSHEAFGRHIEEVYDVDLDKFVFAFYLHTASDDDRCINFDRQRNEIKSYDKSPDNLKGELNEKVEYRWKFKLDDGFQPSTKFTHLHQLKAVGGPEDAMPLITLTARKANPNRIELRYGPNLTQSTIDQTPIAPFLGKWLDARERVHYSEEGLGMYELHITEVSTGDTLFSYVNESIRMWKTDADFIRPKWGIYRSLEDSGSLRDEEVRFADFYVREFDGLVAVDEDLLKEDAILLYPNPAEDYIKISEKVVTEYDQISIYDESGLLVMNADITSDLLNLTALPPGIYFVQFSTTAHMSAILRLLIHR